VRQVRTLREDAFYDVLSADIGELYTPYYNETASLLRESASFNYRIFQCNQFRRTSAPPCADIRLDFDWAK
jgi:hypothetical protein